MTKDEIFSLVQTVPESGCWIWMGSINSSGYGNASHNRKTIRAHRLSWTLFNGLIPDGLWVLHKCDVPSCVNPSHLFLGTAGDNTQDALSKGRMAYGERHGLTKLTTDLVIEIRRRYTSGESPRAIGASLGMNRDSIRKLATGITWRHVPGAVPPISYSEAGR